ncbi:extracellular catalytic domain type 1 short-chain-length polyhydroxyalkanoate depolymerase [Paucimonas lemoignei]|nr:PHB depolymerase family esterase [Paucimonas lemoignei]
MLTGRQSATASQPAGQWLKFNHPLTVLESGRSGGGMDYWLYLPQRADMARLPLVVMLHGCAQTAPQFAQSTGMNRLADKEGFAVLYPQQIARNHAGRCWRWYNPEVREGEAETAAIASIINQVAERYALDRSRIYIAGISAGAAMANIVALTHPQLIAAVGMHSGVAFGAAQTPMEGYALMQQGAEQDMHQAVRAAASKMGQLPLMPAVLIHGREDSIVHPVNLAHLAEQFRELHHLAGYARENMTLKITEKQATRRSGRSYKNCEYYFGRKRLLQVCEISELGHAWSGGDASVNFSDGCGPNASRMMWEFFRRHHRAAEALTSHPAPDVSEVERIQAGLV